MKLRGETGLRRGSQIKSGELLRPSEQREQTSFEWFDPRAHQDLLRSVQDVPVEPEELPNAKRFHQALVEMGFFISVLTADEPSLFLLDRSNLIAAARQSQRKHVPWADTKSWLVSLLDPELRKKAVDLSPEQLRSKVVFGEDRVDLEAVFYLSIGVPEQRKWVIGKIKKQVEDYAVSSAPEDRSIELVEAAAKLILLYPQRREEFLGLLTPEDRQRFAGHVGQLQRRVIGSGAKFIEKLEWAEARFYMQVLAADSARIKTEGGVELVKVQKSFVDTPELPTRSII